MKLAHNLMFSTLLGVSAVAANAATLYVDSIIGDDTNAILGGDGVGENPTCKKTTPCFSIQHALNKGGKGARVVLAPGFYQGNIDIDEDNVRITSTGGAMATTIWGDDNTLGAIVNVNGDSFTLGGKGKGVSVEWLFDPGVVPDPDNVNGIVVNGNKAKIEGNILYGSDWEAPYDNTDHAIKVMGERATIRYNRIQSWNHGVLVDTGGVQAAKALISDNYIDGIGGTCAEISSAGGSADKITNNQIRNCWAGIEPADGLVLDYDGVGADSKPKVQKNSVEGARNGITVRNARPILIGNLVRWASMDSGGDPDTGVAVIFDGTDKGVVKNNMLVSSESAIRLTDSVEATTITGNHMVNTWFGIRIDGMTQSPLKQFSRNNLDSYECQVVLAGDDYSAAPIAMKQNHWYWRADPANGNAPDLSFGADCGNAHVAATVNGSLTFSKSTANPNPVKYKSPI